MLSGSGRTGTNITKKILSQHYCVASLPFEYRFIIDPGGVIDFYNSLSLTWSPYYADKKIKDLEDFLLNLSKKTFIKSILGRIIKVINKDGKFLSPPKYYGWELDKWIPNYSLHVKTLIDDLQEFDYSACWPGAKQYTFNTRLYFSKHKKKKELAVPLSKFLTSCVNDLLKSQSKEVFVDDNTWNFLFAKEMYDLIPNSKLIHIKRDPYDVISSLITQRWSPANIESTSLWYKSILDCWFEKKATVPSEFLYESRFETLMQNTEEELNNICNFMNIPFESKMLDVNLGKANIKRWKTDLSKKDIYVIDSILGDLRIKLGY
jgi:hypothetical protein